jgi:regulatory protein
MVNPEEERVLASSMRSLKMRPHSTAELRQKLVRKRMDREAIELVINRLVDAGLLDDHDFVKRYIEYGLIRKSWGVGRVRAGLREKGIPRETIDEMLADPGVAEMEIEGAQYFVDKKMRVKTPPGEGFKEKVISQLRGRGYRWDVISEVTKIL